MTPPKCSIEAIQYLEARNVPAPNNSELRTGSTWSVIHHPIGLLLSTDIVRVVIIYHPSPKYRLLAGWWFQSLWKILVNGKDDIPNVWHGKLTKFMFQTTKNACWVIGLIHMKSPGNHGLTNGKIHRHPFFGGEMGKFTAIFLVNHG